jgi:hypothetical protein
MFKPLNWIQEEVSSQPVCCIVVHFIRFCSFRKTKHVPFLKKFVLFNFVVFYHFRCGKKGTEETAVFMFLSLTSFHWTAFYISILKPTDRQCWNTLSGKDSRYEKKKIANFFCPVSVEGMFLPGAKRSRERISLTKIYWMDPIHLYVIYFWTTLYTDTVRYMPGEYSAYICSKEMEKHFPKSLTTTHKITRFHIITAHNTATIFIIMRRICFIYTALSLFF